MMFPLTQESLRDIAYFAQGIFHFDQVICDHGIRLKLHR